MLEGIAFTLLTFCHISNKYTLLAGIIKPMKNKLLIPALLLLCTFIQGCFGIEEKILLHKDGSGTYTYTIDGTVMINQMMELVSSLGKTKDSTSADLSTEKTRAKFYEDGMKDLNNDFEMDAKFIELKKINGITSPHQFVDTTNGRLRLGYSYNFDNINTLNKAIKTWATPTNNKKGTKSGNLPPAQFSFKNGVLVREMDKKTAAKFFEDNNSGGADDAMTKLFMKDFKYVVVIEADNDITSVATAGANITNKGKTVVVDYQILDKSDEIRKNKMRLQAKLY